MSTEDTIAAEPAVDSIAVEEPTPRPGPGVAEATEHVRSLVPHAAGSTQLIVAGSPREKLDQAREMATVLHDVIVEQGMRTRIGRSKVVRRDGREEWVDKYHIQIEGWQTLATFLGLAVVPRDPQPIRDDAGNVKVADYEVAREVYPKGTKGKDIRDGRAEPERVERARVQGPEGFTASVDVFKDGIQITSGHSRCTRLEEAWRDRPDYALEGMAATRAASRAVSSAARWIVTLAGYSGTPAEEMPDSEKASSDAPAGDPALPWGPKLDMGETSRVAVSQALVELVGDAEGAKARWGAIKEKHGYISQAVGDALCIVAAQPGEGPQSTSDAATGGEEQNA